MHSATRYNLLLLMLKTKCFCSSRFVVVLIISNHKSLRDLEFLSDTGEVSSYGLESCSADNTKSYNTILRWMFCL